MQQMFVLDLKNLEGIEKKEEVEKSKEQSKLSREIFV